MKVEKVMDLSELKPIASEGLDLKQYNNKQVEVQKISIVQVPSTFTPLIKGSTTEHLAQWVLKVESEPIATLGEGDEKIEFRASELFNLIQDDNGNLKGYPQNDKSNLTKFMKDIGAKVPEEIKGKLAMVKAYEKEQLTDGKKNLRTYLKFKY